MGTDPNAADEALERMLSGAPVDDEWRDVASFVGELQDATPSSVLASEDLHVAAMVETAHRLPKQRRKPVKSIVTKVLAPIAAVLTVFGGMAYAGALPHTVQKAVSHAASTVGINVASDDDEQGDNNDQGEDTQGDEGKDDVITPQDPSDDQTQGSDDQGESSDPTSGDDQGENDDNQGDNNDQGEDSQGDSTDQTSGDDQGDTSQSNDQGDQGGDTQSGDGTSGGGDQQGDSQD